MSVEFPNIPDFNAKVQMQVPEAPIEVKVQEEVVEFSAPEAQPEPAPEVHEQQIQEANDFNDVMDSINKEYQEPDFNNIEQQYEVPKEQIVDTPDTPDIPNMSDLSDLFNMPENIVQPEVQPQPEVEQPQVDEQAMAQAQAQAQAALEAQQQAEAAAEAQAAMEAQQQAEAQAQAQAEAQAAMEAQAQAQAQAALEAQRQAEAQAALEAQAQAAAQAQAQALFDSAQMQEPVINEVPAAIAPESVEEIQPEIAIPPAVGVSEVSAVNQVNQAPDSAAGSAVAGYAMQFLGNPYVYGGTSLTNGCDCSGFVMGVYNNFGISLPHSSDAMASLGQDVGGYENLQPGDVMVFPHHVAIYAGNGNIVHAESSKTGIVLTPLANRRTPPLAIRRMI